MTPTFARSSLVPLCLAAACGGDSPAPIVTEPVRHAELDLTPAGADLGPDAVAYAGERVGLADGDELEVLSVRTGPDGLRHARLRQVHRGVPVWGTEIAVHADASTFLGFNGRMTRNLGDMDLAPALDEAAALAAARSTRGDRVVYDLERATLTIWPRDPAGADLVWHVELSNRRQPAADAGRWNIVVDAATATVLERWNELHSLEQASGPGGNDKVSWSWNGELDVEANGGEYWMETDRLRTHDGANGDQVVHGPDLANMEDKAANDAHGFAEATLDMMSEWVGQDSLDGNGFVVVSRVHDLTFCGGAPDNACWNGAVMSYGDGAPGGAFHPFSGGIDVVGHELNHGFTQFHSHLAYAKQSGALNESFSDIAGTMVEFYRLGEGADFVVGEDITAGAEPMRNMCEPSKDAAFWLEHRDYWLSIVKDEKAVDEWLKGQVSIDHAGKYTDDLDVHLTSGVPNRAYCLAVGRAKAGGATTVEAVRRIGILWYAANAGYWTSTSTYAEACRGIVDAGLSLGFSDEALLEIAQSWADVGVTCAGDPAAGGTGRVCDNDGACELLAGETCVGCEDCGTCDECGPFQLAKCRMGLADCSACGGDGVVGCGDGVCSVDETPDNCGIDCGCAARDVCESLAPFGCWCDAACDPAVDYCCPDLDVCSSP
jgi:vibriolysin